jgi:transmembrane protein TMEM174 (potassium channel)
MAAQRTTSERLAAFSDGVFAVIITIMVLDLRPPPQPTLAALLPLWPTALSYAVSYLFIAIVWVNHHHLLRFAEHATPRLIWGELRAPVHGVAGTVLDRVGRGYSTGGGSGVCVCSGICAGELGVLRIRVGGAGSGRRREGLGSDAADHANAIVPDVGNIRDHDVTVTQVSFVGLWVGLLRFACLSLAGISHMKMRATLKLNNSGAARNAVAGKTISSSQRSNPLTVVSLLDPPDHKNVRRCMLA